MESALPVADAGDAIVAAVLVIAVLALVFIWYYDGPGSHDGGAPPVT